MIQIPKEKVLQAYKEADEGGLITLNNLFGGSPFYTNIKEWEDYIIPLVPSFEAACRITGDDPQDMELNSGTSDEIAYKQLKVVIEAFLPPGWEWDWSPNNNQQKWAPYFVHTGSGFRFLVSDYALTLTTGGSRLRLCSKRISDYVGTQFLDHYNRFLL